MNIFRLLVFSCYDWTCDFIRREAPDSRREKSPDGEGEVTSQIGASVPRVDLVSDDSDEEGKVSFYI